MAGATAVLPKPSHLHQTLTSSSPPPKPRRNTKAVSTKRRRKRTPAVTRGDHENLVRYSPAMVAAKKLMHGEVKILKRGELLVNSREHKEEGEDVSGPKPDTLKKVVTEVYFRRWMFSSPPPSSLPIPGFLCRTGSVIVT